MVVSRDEFESLVQEALDELPDQFAELLENVAVVVEDEPSDHDLAALHGRDHELLGIYRGVARPRRSFSMLPELPDRIAIFRGPILRVTRSRADAIRQVRDTVIHELGHYFGLSDAEMPY